MGLVLAIYCTWYYCWTKEPPALLEHTVLKQTNVSEARFVRRYDEETKEVVAALEKR